MQNVLSGLGSCACSFEAHFCSFRPTTRKKSTTMVISQKNADEVNAKMARVAPVSYLLIARFTVRSKRAHKSFVTGTQKSIRKVPTLCSDGAINVG